MKQKNTKRLMLIGIILLIFVIIVVLFINLFLDSIIERKIKDAVTTATKNVYSIRYDTFELKLLNGDISLGNLHLIPDTTQIKHIKTNKLVEIATTEFRLQGINYIKLFFHKNIVIKNILIVKPKITVFSIKNKQIDNKFDSDENLNQNKNKKLNTLFVDNIKLEEGSFKLIDYENNYLILNTEKFDTNIENLNFLINHNNNKQLNYSIGNVNSIINHLTWNLANRKSVVKINKADLSTSKSNLVLDTLSYISYDKRTKGHENIIINSKSAEISKIDFDKLFSTGHLYADEINLDKFKIEVHGKNKKNKTGSNQKIIKWPQEIFRGLKLKYKLNKISLNNGYFSFDQYNNETENTYKLFITNFESDILNISNDTVSNGADIVTDINISGKIMGQGKFYADIKMPLYNNNFKHSFSGTIGPMEFTDFNPILENTARIKAKQGHIKTLFFNIEADNDYAKGNVKFYYNDLQILLLDKNNRKKRKRLLSFIINNTNIIRSDNPTLSSKNKKFNEGLIYYQRDKTKPFFAFWMNSLLSGITKSIIPEKIEKKLQKQKKNK